LIPEHPDEKQIRQKEKQLDESKQSTTLYKLRDWMSHAMLEGYIIPDTFFNVSLDANMEKRYPVLKAIHDVLQNKNIRLLQKTQIINLAVQYLQLNSVDHQQKLKQLLEAILSSATDLKNKDDLITKLVEKSECNYRC